MSKKTTDKVNQALELIASKLPDETIIFDTEGRDYIIAKAKNRDMKLAVMDRDINPFATWPRLIIKAAKKFIEQYVPLVESMKNVVQK